MMTMSESPQFSPQDLAILAEIKYNREKIARLEAQRDQLYGLDHVNERHTGGQYQADLDPAYEFHGRKAPQQKEGESANMYRRRLLAGLAPYSKDPDVAKFDFLDKRSPNHVPDFALPRYADSIKADALDPASHRADVPPGQIKEIVRRDMSGRETHEFVNGDGRTTFIHEIAAQTSPRRIVRRMYGVDVIGNNSTRPVEKPRYMGRMALRGGLPRSA
jgi:hypothetical protein